MRISRPWILAAFLWLSLSLLISSEILHTLGPNHLLTISGLLSLLWLQFGFAGLFHTLLKERGRNLVPMALIALLPPLLLFFFNACFIR